jgi:hypothetical protein
MTRKPNVVGLAQLSAGTPTRWVPHPSRLYRFHNSSQIDMPIFCIRPRILFKPFQISEREADRQNCIVIRRVKLSCSDLVSTAEGKAYSSHQTEAS